MKKSVLWFVLWLLCLIGGSLFSLFSQIALFNQHGVWIQHPPYANYQLFLLLVFLPCCLILPLCISCYHAIKEKNKALKITSLVLIFQHVLCLIAILLQVIADK